MRDDRGVLVFQRQATVLGSKNGILVEWCRSRSLVEREEPAARVIGLQLRARLAEVKSSGFCGIFLVTRVPDG